ncbi:MAG: Dabb family protein [Desulfobacterales bacterium]|nr:Dabb family protein [Desulfobacterales bacterium]
MIQHMVVFKLKADVDETAFAELEQKLADLPNHIAEIESLAFGLDVVRSERSYDFGLLAGFKDLEALRRYQEHPKHQEVLTRLKAFARSLRWTLSPRGRCHANRKFHKIAPGFGSSTRCIHPRLARYGLVDVRQ